MPVMTRTHRLPSAKSPVRRFWCDTNHPRHGGVGKLLLGALILVGIATGVLAWNGTLLRRGEAHLDLIVETVKKGPLEITITERGNLESANNQTLVWRHRRAE